MFRPQSATSRQESEMQNKSQRELQAMGDSGDPIQKLRLLCLSRGAHGILGLGRIFRIMDEDGSKNLNLEEFVTGLKEIGMDISDEEAKEMFEKFDNDGSGSINIDEFLVHIRPVPTKRKTLDQMYGHNIKKPKNNKPNLKDTNNFNKFGETTANLIATSIATIKNDETIEKSTVENFVELQITANSAHTKQNKLTNKEIVQKGTFGNFKEEESTAVKVETTEIAKKSWKRSLQKDDIVIKRENNNVQYKATQTHATQTNNQESQTAVTQNKHQSTQTHATQISNQESQTAVTENIHQNTQTHATQTNNQESQTAVSQNIHQNTQTDIQETYFKMVKSSSAETTFIYKDQLALQDEVKILKAEIPSKT